MSITDAINAFVSNVQTRLTLPIQSQHKRLFRKNGTWSPVKSVTELEIVDAAYKLTVAKNNGNFYPIYDTVDQVLWTYTAGNWVNQSLTVAQLISSDVLIEKYMVLSRFDNRYYYVLDGNLTPITDGDVVNPLYGIDWVGRTAAAAQSWTSVTFGNGLYVAVSADGTNRVMTSPDGITWTLRTATVDGAWSSVTYGNSLYVAVATSGTNRVMTSSNGFTWTARTAAVAVSWHDICYGNGIFVASGQGNIMSSSDGITWTVRSTLGGLWGGVTFANGLFVAVGNNGLNSIQTSPDGITWTLRTTPVSGGKTTVAYGKGLYVTIPSENKAAGATILYSSDGVTWNTTTDFPDATGGWQSVCYANGLFVAVAQSLTPRVMTSSDGITWTGRTAAELSSWRSVCFGDKRVVAVADSGTFRVMTSP